MCPPERARQRPQREQLDAQGQERKAGHAESETRLELRLHPLRGWIPPLRESRPSPLSPYRLRPRFPARGRPLRGRPPTRLLPRASRSTRGRALLRDVRGAPPGPNAGSSHAHSPLSQPRGRGAGLSEGWALPGRQSDPRARVG